MVAYLGSSLTASPVPLRRTTHTRSSSVLPSEPFCQPWRLQSLSSCFSYGGSCDDVIDARRIPEQRSMTGICPGSHQLTESRQTTQPDHQGMEPCHPRRNSTAMINWESPRYQFLKLHKGSHRSMKLTVHRLLQTIHHSLRRPLRCPLQRCCRRQCVSREVHSKILK